MHRRDGVRTAGAPGESLQDSPTNGYNDDPMQESTHRDCRALLAALTRLRNRHFFLIDIAVLAIAPTLALALRHDGFALMHAYWQPLLAYTLISGIVYLVAFAAFGLYQRYWQDATVEEALLIVSAVVAGMLVSMAMVAVAARHHVWSPMLPSSVPLTEGLLLLAALGGNRFSARMARRLMRVPPGPDAARTLIIGAGDVGQWLARDVLRSGPKLDIRLVGFIDDDPGKQGVRILGIPVLGNRNDLHRIADAEGVSQAIIAMPSAPGKTIREIVNQCEQAGIGVRTVPSLSAILLGNVLVSQLRKVEIDDLLRRERVETDIEQVTHLLRGRRVLVTGAGGSIGSELCRQVLQCRPAQIVLLGHGENSIFDIHNELTRTVRVLDGARDGADEPATTLVPIIADIRSLARLRRVFADYPPDIVFHAAAHKHVPLMETSPTEAIANNTLGTWNVIQAARAVGVQRLVMISTDKAVNPTSIMGASKRAAELVVLNAARETRHAYVTVRFGNVLGSRGSVVPIFKRQIAEGGPITITHPEMTRYFMTIPEAVQLVLEAAVLGKGGEVFMLDMGDPVRIVDLARDIVELSGLELNRDIELQFTGIRPGEKLHEELFLPGERYERTAHDKVLIVRGASETDVTGLQQLIEEAQRAVREDDDARAMEVLERLVPELRPREPVRLAPDRACVEARENAAPVSGE
jgi:FlaA1/EpsC-like NDP-sugar epimerase